MRFANYSRLFDESTEFNFIRYLIHSFYNIIYNVFRVGFSLAETTGFAPGNSGLTTAWIWCSAYASSNLLASRGQKVDGCNVAGAQLSLLLSRSTRQPHICLDCSDKKDIHVHTLGIRVLQEMRVRVGEWDMETATSKSISPRINGPRDTYIKWNDELILAHIAWTRKYSIKIPRPTVVNGVVVAASLYSLVRGMVGRDEKRTECGHITEELSWEFVRSKLLYPLVPWFKAKTQHRAQLSGWILLETFQQ